MTIATSQRSRWIAAGLLVFCRAMIAFSVASAVLPGRSLLPDDPIGVGDLLTACSVFVSLPTIGAMLAILRPANPIGWLFLLCGVGFVFSIFTTEYVGRGVFTDADLPGVALVDWVGSWIGLASIGLALVWIPLLFPDGHLPAPSWRPVAWFAGAWLTIATVSMAILPDEAHGYQAQLPNPVGVSGPLGEIATLIVGAVLPGHDLPRHAGARVGRPAIHPIPWRGTPAVEVVPLRCRGLRRGVPRRGDHREQCSRGTSSSSGSPRCPSPLPSRSFGTGCTTSIGSSRDRSPMPC